MSAVSTASPSRPRASGLAEPVRLRRLAPRLLGAALALPLLTYASVGAFARYVADDYCWAGVLRERGFFTAQVQWFVGYSPRYAFTFLVNLVELAGPAIVPALPVAGIVVWLAVLSWTCAQLRFPRGAAFVFAEVMALATLQTAPDLGQSLYWQTGLLTYLLPLVLASFLLGWIVRAVCRGRLGARSVALSLLVTFVAGGLSETYLIPQNVALTVTLVTWAIWGPTGTRRVALPHLAAALGGGVLALAVIVLAPSTASRVGGTPADLWLASSAAIATAVYQVVRLARYFPLSILICLLFPSVVFGALPTWRGRAPVIVSRRWFVLVTALVAITVPFCYFPSFYAQNGNPPARSLIVPGSLLIGYLLFAGYAAYTRLGRVRLPAPALVAATLVVLLVPLGIAVTTVPEIATAAQYAALWDAEDQQIRASRDAGQADVTVPPLPRNLGEAFVTPDRANWFNVCVARYYGVRTIAAQAGG